MKIVTVVGARPQFVKAAVVSRALERATDIEEVLVHTGQHYDQNMSDVFFDELSIPRPKYNLQIGSGLHGWMTGRQLEAIEKVLISETPDWVLVFGDTNSTLSGALAATKLNIPVAHVEAGLRSFNRRMPEEINRILTDHASSLLFTPTMTAVGNLNDEGIHGSKVLNVGDVMFDATLFYQSKAKRPDQIIEKFNLSNFLLATIHRTENTDEPKRLQGILEGLAISERTIVLPLHPRTRAKLEALSIPLPQNLCIIDPVGYLEMLWFEQHCTAIITDSGGLQKEAYYHGKPCVTMRDETEWTELVDLGANKLVGCDPSRIASAISNIEGPINRDRHLFGDGNAGLRIAMAMQEA